LPVKRVTKRAAAWIKQPVPQATPDHRTTRTGKGTACLLDGVSSEPTLGHAVDPQGLPWALCPAAYCREIGSQVYGTSRQTSSGIFAASGRPLRCLSARVGPSAERPSLHLTFGGRASLVPGSVRLAEPRDRPNRRQACAKDQYNRPTAAQSWGWRHPLQVGRSLEGLMRVAARSRQAVGAVPQPRCLRPVPRHKAAGGGTVCRPYLARDLPPRIAFALRTRYPPPAIWHTGRRNGGWTTPAGGSRPDAPLHGRARLRTLLTRGLSVSKLG
jgi:hypothetical protein